MKELVEKLIAAIPVYVKRLIELLRDPRGFVGKIDLDSEDALKEALTFLAISFGLAFIAQIPLLPEKQNKEIMFGVAAVLAAVAFLMSVLSLVVSWKIVGGKLTFKKFIIVSSYFSGVSTLLSLVFALIGLGVFKGLDPETAQQVLSGAYSDPVDLIKSTGYRAFWVVFGVGFVLVLVWVFRIWRTYRELNQVSKTRSAIAFVIFLLLSPVAIALQFGMAAGLSATAAPHFPAELVGLWEVRRDSTANAMGIHNAMTVNFNSMGYYFMLISKGTTNGKCYVMISDGSNGHATVSGSNLTLHVQKHTESTDDTCNGTKSEFAKDTTNEVFQYQLRQSPEGQQLCLIGKLGEACMSPKKQ